MSLLKIKNRRLLDKYFSRQTVCFFLFKTFNFIEIFAVQVVHYGCSQNRYHGVVFTETGF